MGTTFSAAGDLPWRRRRYGGSLHRMPTPFERLLVKIVRHRGGEDVKTIDIRNTFCTVWLIKHQKRYARRSPEYRLFRADMSIPFNKMFLSYHWLEENGYLRSVFEPQEDADARAKAHGLDSPEHLVDGRHPRRRLYSLTLKGLALAKERHRK